VSSFEQAIPVVLKHEGGYSNNKKDPGGATNYGISIRFLRAQGRFLDLDGDGDMDAADMQLLTVDTAIEIYRDLIWEPNRYAQIADQELATKVFDLAVNMGAQQANRLLQRALRACGVALKEDGVLGLVTLGAVNKVPGFPQLVGLRATAAGYYRALVAAKPDQYRDFLTGWLNRAYA